MLCQVRGYFYLKIRPSPMQPPAQGHRGRGRECKAVAMLAGGRQPAQQDIVRGPYPKDTREGSLYPPVSTSLTPAIVPLIPRPLSPLFLAPSFSSRSQQQTPGLLSSNLQ